MEGRQLTTQIGSCLLEERQSNRADGQCRLGTCFDTGSAILHCSVHCAWSDSQEHDPGGPKC